MMEKVEMCFFLAYRKMCLRNEEFYGMQTKNEHQNLYQRISSMTYQLESFCSIFLR
jgi:hypothetical protein